MLRIYPSNRTESLSAVMGAIVRSQPLKSPFSSEKVLIQSQGMGTWLRQQLSSQLGIAALIETQMPAGFIWKLAQGLMSDQGVSPQFEKGALRWELLRQLPDLLERESFRPLREYVRTLDQQRDVEASGSNKQSGVDISEPNGHLANSPQASYSQTTLFQLSDVLADCFDAYQNYRADWVDQWELGQSPFTGLPEHILAMEAWQAELWRAVYPNLAATERLHRPRQLAALCQRLESGVFSKELLPERLFVFGLSALPPQWLPIFILLGRYIDIHFLIQNPCKYYWGDVQTELQQLRYQQSLQQKGLSAETSAEQFVEGNSLLASWGKLGRDYLGTLYQYDETQGVSEFESSLFDDWVDESSAEGVDSSSFVEGQAHSHIDISLNETSALQVLQQDVMELRSRSYIVSADDRSIRFADCHSALREVEALKDYLLDALDSDPSLALKDIIVMMPDVQDYAPLVDAVFSQSVVNQAGQEQFLNYAISDQSLSYDLSLVEWLQQLLVIDQSRVSSTEVLDWLTIEVIRERFSITESELEMLHHWIDYLNVRWGLSAGHRDRLRLIDATELSSVNSSGHANTWLSATRRLVQGYLCGEESLVTLQGQTVLAVALNTTESQVLLGKLLRFIEVIERSIEGLSGVKTGPEWISTLYGLIRSWVSMDAVQPAFIHLCDSMFRQLREQWQVSEFDAPLSFSVIAHAIKNQLEQERVSQRFLAGRINFCTLMPMRSIPFRVVCLLGMNEGQYPRPVSPSSFDLMALTPSRVGDRSRREDDRYLFLEALLSVRERLYLSYCGRDVRDNSERYPSVLVSELRDYCRRYFYLAGNHTNAGLDEPGGVASNENNSGTHSAENEVLNAWTQMHRLQAFHPEYFQSNPSSQPLSYAGEWLGLHRIVASEGEGNVFHGDNLNEDHRAGSIQPSSVADSGSEVALDVLIKAFNHPLKFYYLQNFQLRPSFIDAALEEVEPFALDFLEQFQLKQDLLALNGSGSEGTVGDEDVMLDWQLSERMPGGVLGEFELNQAKQAVAPLRERMRALEPPVYQDIEVSVDGQTVVGRVLLSGGAPVAVFSGKSAATSFFGFWVQHVFWSLARARTPDFNIDEGGPSQLIGKDKAWLLPLLTEAAAEQYAQGLLQSFESMKLAPLMFLPKTAFAMLFGSASAVSSSFYGAGGNYGGVGECEDFYWRRSCMFGKEPVDPTLFPEYLSHEVGHETGHEIVQQIAAHVPEIKELSR